MKELLKVDWENKYYNYIDNLEFEDKSLKIDFLDLLKKKDSKTRERLWMKLKVRITAIREVWKLSNPYFIGFGNPDSKILFLGKEKGFDISIHPELLLKESINNIIHWDYINKVSKPIVHKEILDELDFNPLFPRFYHKRKISKRHTWGLYSQIIAGINTLNYDTIFTETVDFNNSFFKYCFISEINHIPSKYSQGNKLIGVRKNLLQQEFYRKFPIVIIGAKGYLTLEEIKELFDIKVNGTEISLGSNKQHEIKIHKFISENQTIIYCNQLSGAAGWTNNAIDNLINKISK